MRKGRRDSRSGEESSSRGSAVKPLKKGPWTSDEDAILIAYVQKHGEGNWNAVQKHSGLSRCGKSCRLRWANHLRPDLKKGAFTQEEEQRIIELHAVMGNKWARMAAELPGRTDNEIKNFWNTRLKRLQRAGLPIYPDEVCQQVMNAAQNGQNIDVLTNGDAHSHDSMQTDNFEIPEVEFKHLELSQSLLSYPSMLLDVPSSSMLKQGIISPPDAYNLMAPPSMPNRKRLRESETLFPVVDGYATSGTQFVNYAYEKTGGDSLAMYASYTSDLKSPERSSQLNTLFDSHHLGNATYSSSSEPLISGATKLELPSFQYLDSQYAGGWETPSNLMPALESVDTLIQSPPTDLTQSDCPSSQNNGLLESVLFESQVLNGSTKPVDSLKKIMDAKTDSISPLVQSSSSVITPVSGSSSGYTSNFELNFAEPELNPSVKREEIPELTDTGWFSYTNSNEKYKCSQGDFIRELLGEDFSSY